MLISLFSFIIIKFTKLGKKELLKKEIKLSNGIQFEEENLLKKSKYYSSFFTIRLCIIQFILSFFENAVLVSCMPYVFLPYPNGSSLLGYAIIFGMILRPIASALAYFLPFIDKYYTYQNRIFPIMGFIFCICCMMIQLVNAFLSPNVLFRNSLTFGIFLVSINVIGYCLIDFIKTREFHIFHKMMEEFSFISYSCNISPFRKAGLSIQFGGLIGSICMFLFIQFGIIHE